MPAAPSTMASVSDTSDKPTLRRSVLAHRRAVPLAERSAGDAARTAALVTALRRTPGLRGARIVTCYVSVGAEPDTSALRAALAAAGLRVLLPRLRADGSLDWALDARGSTVGGRGIPEPTGPALDPYQADLWLVPALAVDRRGTRLGRGGGSYDRSLPADRPVVALLHDGELVPALPAESHDRPVSHVALPTGVVAL